MANALIHESSPYLLQHAHNPVDWYPWGETGLKKAKDENKLILVSIGYAACHWCHVMEHECFEDQQVADLMNAHFVNIKVDREERPDIDHVYMDALMIMTQHGGWPLNCITLPDGRPVYGGTYFPRDHWKSILMQLATLWEKDAARMIDYASQLTEGLRSLDQIAEPPSHPFSISELRAMTERWKTILDMEEGGPDRAPKFPMPNNYLFLQRAAYYLNDPVLDEAVAITLRKMALGGIFDQVGGGFARYSTDKIWKVPHFEKMLYDNGQLVSLYCEAFRKDPQYLYKAVVKDTLEWVQREMTSPEGGFYSSLDADSEGVEGKFYVWSEKELAELLGEDAQWLNDLCDVTAQGNWEHGNNILMLREPLLRFGEQMGWTEETTKANWARVKDKLLTRRATRIRPGLDDKILASWNALMLRGLAEAAVTFGNQEWMDAAVRNAEFILSSMTDGSRLWRNYKNGKAGINAFLDDYALCIDAFIYLFSTTGEARYLDKAHEWTRYTLAHFFDGERSMFYFTSDEDAPLITRKLEIMDNVIPAANSVMANNLFLLSRLLENTDYENIALNMLRNVQSQMSGYGSSYSNWGILLLRQLFPFYESVVTGPGAVQATNSMQRNYLPQTLFAPAGSETGIPIFRDRLQPGRLQFFICENKVCNLPVSDMGEALKLLRYDSQGSSS